MTKLLIYLIGLSILALEIAALDTKKKVLKRTPQLKPDSLSMTATWIIGLVLATIAISLNWTYSENVRIIGFPFPAQVSQLENGKWVDFTSAGSSLIQALNFLVALLFPQIIVALGLLSKEKEEKKKKK